MWLLILERFRAPTAQRFCSLRKYGLLPLPKRDGRVPPVPTTCVSSPTLMRPVPRLVLACLHQTEAPLPTVMRQFSPFYQYLISDCPSIRPTADVVGTGPVGAVSMSLSPFVAPRLRELVSSAEPALPAQLNHARRRRGAGVITYCQCCGRCSLYKKEVPCKQEGLRGGREPLAYVYTCDACREHYLSLTYFNKDESRVEAWWYYVGQAPLLHRTARYQPTGFMKEHELVLVEYLIGAERVTETVWKTALDQKRRTEHELGPAS